MENERISWDLFFIEVATLMSTRSTCNRRKVGAVIVKDKRIISTGHNGAPKGLSHCLEIGCMRENLNIPSGQRQELCRGIHAEENAILQAAKFGVSIEGATMYCTNQPCSYCAKSIINVGITKIYYKYEYNDELAMKLFSEADILCIKI